MFATIWMRTDAVVVDLDPDDRFTFVTCHEPFSRCPRSLRSSSFSQLAGRRAPAG